MDTLNLETIMGAAGPLGEQVKTLFDTLAPAFFVINGAGLALGIALLVYAIVAGTVQTATEGQFLGKRFSSVWLPIRLAFGAFLLVPAFDGLAIAQKIILWFAVAGIGLANLAADALTIPNPQFFVPGPVAQNLAQQEFIRQSCKSGIKIGYTTMLTTDKDGGYLPAREDICGAVTFPAAGIDVDTTAGPAAAAIEARGRAFNSMSDRLHKIAEADYYKRLDAEDLKQQIEAAGREYSATMKAVGADIGVASGQNQQKTTNFVEFGFAGSFASLKQQQLAADIAALPKIGTTEDANISAYSDLAPIGIYCGEAPDAPCPISWWQMRHSLSARLGIDLASGGKPPLLSETTNVAAGSESTSAQATGGGNGLIEKLFGKIGDGIKEWAAGWQKGGATNPILYSQNLGQTLLNVLSAAGTVAVVLAMVPAIGTPVMPVFLSFAIPLGGLAIMLSSYVPLIPSILWLMALVSWIVLILEGMLGSVLWALIHLEPEGEGMGNRTQRGYLFLADLFFRPAFLVIAFAAANIILVFTAGLANGFFAKSLQDYQTTGFGSLIGLVGAVGVCSFILISLVSRVYSACLAVPDQIMNWLGGMGMGSSVSNNDVAQQNTGQQITDAGRGLSTARSNTPTPKPAGTDTKVS